MKLSQWAKNKGISYKTAYRLFQAGTLPIKTEQLPTGTILVYPEQATEARISTIEQQLDEILVALAEIKAELSK